MPQLKRLSRRGYVRLLSYRLDFPLPSGKGKKAEKARADYLEDQSLVERYLGTLREHMDRVETIGHICYENLAMDSSMHGFRQFLPVGPCWRQIQTLEEVFAQEGMGQPIGSAPSTYCYPQYYWRKPVSEEDVEWERLQDRWDQEHPVFSCGRRPFQEEAVAEEWVETQLRRWREAAREATA